MYSIKNKDQSLNTVLRNHPYKKVSNKDFHH